MTNCNNLKRDGKQAAEQCRQDQQMLAELHDKYQLMRQQKGDINDRAAVWVKILIAIKRTIKIFNRTIKIFYITSIARCKSQQNVLTTESKI